MGTSKFKKSNIHQIKNNSIASLTTDFTENSEITLPGIKLGQAANLVFGFKNGWDFTKSGSAPFFAPETAPLPEVDAKISGGANAIWSLPTITIHKDANSLLTAIYPYHVEALNGDKSNFSVPSGPLMIEDLDKDRVLNELHHYLDIDLTKGDSYMLVELNRVVGTASKSYISGSGGASSQHLMPNALDEVNTLLGVSSPTNESLNTAHTQEFLDCFNKIGTHYISQVKGGDRIFQIYAYEATEFKKIESAFKASAKDGNSISGIHAISFQYYTTPVSTHTGVKLGYASQRGKVLIASNDTAFTKSLKAGDWNDTLRADGNSIFSAYDQKNKVNLEAFNQVVPVSITLSPIGNLIPVTESAQGRENWNAVLKGGFVQKYSDSVRISFPTQDSYNWKELLPNTGTWLTTLSTPTINVYDGHVSLDKIELANKNAVKDFSSWSVVVESTQAKVQIPGNQVSIYSFLIDTTGTGNPPTLELASKEAYNSLAMVCGKMDGAMSISYLGGTDKKTLLQGVILESTAAVGATNRSSIKIQGDILSGLTTQQLEPQIPNINFSIVTCQTLLYARGKTAKDSETLSKDCLNWLSSIIPNDDTVSADLAAIGLRTAYLANIAKNLDEEGVPVPYLNYNSYKDYINSMTSAAKSLNSTIYQYQNRLAIQKNAELTAKTAKEINDNVKISGNLLKDYIDAVATNQGDIADNYQSIIDTKQRELTSAIGSLDNLVNAVEEQKIAVGRERIAFQQAMVKYEEDQIIKAVVNISMSFMALGSTIVIPSNTITALKDLGETAQKIQKLLNILQKIVDLGKTIETSVKNITAVTNAMNNLKQAQLDMPTSLEWSEMSINFDASLASVPSEVAGPKAKFVASFKILVLRAQAMITAQSKIAQINAEIMLNKAQKKINDDQQKRLNKITKGLNLGNTSEAPDMGEVDLLSLTGHVQSQLNQILGSLAQALAVQDSAIHYELLADPTSITKFDLNSLQIVMVSQQANIIAAKQAFNPPPFNVNDPIKYIIKGVPVKDLINGNTFEFEIQPSASEFQPYNMVRVQQVVVDIPQVSGSKGGDYRIDLTCLGNPFEDRDQDGTEILFNTVSRKFGPFRYNAKTHKLLSGDSTGSIGADFTKITPFSSWKVSIPNLSTNEGVEFGGSHTVDIVLSFKIQALAQKALYSFVKGKKRAIEQMPHAEHLTLLKKTLFIPSPSFASNMSKTVAEPATTNESSLQNMLTQMNKAQGVLKGWDCVLNMMEDPVNKFIAEQYAEKYPTAKPMTVEVGFCQSFNVGGKSLHAYTKFSVDLAQPLLEFQANNHNYVKVTQDIKSGYLQTGTVMVDGKNVACPVPLDLKNPAIDWDDKQPIDTSKKPTLVGTVSLGLVQGEVTPTLPDGSKGNKDDAHTVILDFSKGSFNAENLDIDTDNAQLNLQLQNWFVNNPISYQINTVVYNKASTLVALQPTKFKLNVLTTNSNKNILQVFITTSGKQQNNLTINVNEPIPDGFDNSLMINTKIMFQDIFVKSFNKAKTNLQVESIDPKNDYTAWAAKVSTGTVSGTVDWGKHNTNSRQYQIHDNGNNNITWPLVGLTFNPTVENGVALTYDQAQNVPFQSRSYNCYSSQGGTYCSWSSWSKYNVDVTVKLSGYYPLTVHNTGVKQEIQIANTPPKVDVIPPDLEPTGPCECNANDLKIMVGQLLQDQVPSTIKDSISGIKFEPVSLFALYNLLFPTTDFIAMDSAYVPGDLVVLGTFTKFTDDSDS